MKTDLNALCAHLRRIAAAHPDPMQGQEIALAAKILQCQSQDIDDLEQELSILVNKTLKGPGTALREE